MSEVNNEALPSNGAASDAGAHTSRIEVRKRIVVEEVTVTLPVRREVVDVYQVMADGTEHFIRTPDSTWEPRVENRMDDDTVEPPAARRLPPEKTLAADEEGGVDIVLYEERPVITTEVYAFERFRLEG